MPNNSKCFNWGKIKIKLSEENSLGYFKIIVKIFNVYFSQLSQEKYGIHVLCRVW